MTLPLLREQVSEEAPLTGGVARAAALADRGRGVAVGAVGAGGGSGGGSVGAG